MAQIVNTTVINTATEHVLSTLGEMASSYGPQDWIQGRIAAMSQIGKDISSSDNKIAAIAANGFFMMNQPASETSAAALATASIAAMSIVYTMTMAFLGLGGPISLLASLLAPGLQAAWVAWVISISTVWFWYTSYLAVMWFLSKLLSVNQGRSRSSRIEKYNQRRNARMDCYRETL